LGDEVQGPVGSDAKGAPAGIITGAASGIGAATAREFARLGGRLVLASLSLDGIDTLTNAIVQVGGEAIPVEVDVRDPEQVATLAQLALDHFGRIDFLVANAGIADQSSIVSGDPARWRNVIETNLLGAIYCVRYVAPHMVRQRSGHIFLMASLSGRETYVGEPIYIASKWGLVGFGHALRKEVLSAGIRVTLIEPGLVDTPLTRFNPMIKTLLEATEPLQPEDVARAVVYAYTQPANVVISEMAVRPLRQDAIVIEPMAGSG
jgi:NADP-dependent 3-hydroxy acid dehydrogenase YdfG